MSDLLVCESVSKTYHDGETDTPVLKDVSFSIKTGQQVAILGSSGSGKSTLLHILGGLDHPTSGTVTFSSQDIFSLSPSKMAALRNEDMGFIYQFHHLLPEFNAIENVAMPLMIAGESPTVAKLKSKELLARVGLSHREDHRPGALSGGERQRVAIARALVTGPKLVLADEPTGNLDEETGKHVYDLLCELSNELGTSFVVVTHDHGLAEKMDDILTLRKGALVSRNNKESH